jgi:4-hydroxy-tetrahydrodipicolinate reductase
MARLALKRRGLEVVAAVAKRPGKAGRDLGEVLGLDVETGVRVSLDPRKAFGEGAPNVVLHSTGSLVREVYPEILLLCEMGTHVVSVAEEMAFPWAQWPQEAEEMDKAALKAGVTLLGTGINPGFVLDALILCLTGATAEVTCVKARRVNDLSPFGPTVMRTQGVGTTPEEFEKGLEDGTIVGHIGFPESISLVAKALGWRLDRIIQERHPIISKSRRETPYVRVSPGMVAGCRHTARGIVGGKVVIEMEHPQQVHPETEGTRTGDYIEIQGEPCINMAIQPEIPGGTGTIAVALNMVPVALEARPGLLTMADLPVPRGVGHGRGDRP